MGHISHASPNRAKLLTLCPSHNYSRYYRRTMRKFLRFFLLIVVAAGIAACKDDNKFRSDYSLRSSSSSSVSSDSGTSSSSISSKSFSSVSSENSSSGSSESSVAATSISVTTLWPVRDENPHEFSYSSSGSYTANAKVFYSTYVIDELGTIVSVEPYRSPEGGYLNAGWEFDYSGELSFLYVVAATRN